MAFYDSLEDKELIILLKQGQKPAFDQIYLRYSEFLYRFAYNILKDEQECTDAIQDIFVWFWHNREKIEVSNLKSYLCAAVKYKLVRVIQRSKRRTEILDANPEIKTEAYIDDSLEVKELKSVIKHFVETLPPKAREIFELSRNQYLSNKEIAAKLGISEKTVENQLTIALKKLKVNLGRQSFWSVII